MGGSAVSNQNSLVASLTLLERESIKELVAVLKEEITSNWKRTQMLSSKYRCLKLTAKTN